VCTVHATDSFRTERPDLDVDIVNVLDSTSPKVVRVEEFLGAISWFGYSGHGDNDILGWFEDRATNPQHHRTAADFADYLANEINNHFYHELGLRPGIGVHFTAYEQVGVENLLVPELFYIHNYDGAYQPANRRVLCQRHSRFTVSQMLGEGLIPDDRHGEEAHRMRVWNYLNTNLLVYNNPRPELFVPAFNQLYAALRGLAAAGAIEGKVNFCTDVAVMPIQIVSHTLQQTSPPNTITIGGDTHFVVIRPDVRSVVQGRIPART
jgi:hypothetical protein